MRKNIANGEKKSAENSEYWIFSNIVGSLV